jgi:hypothetical protein
MPTDNFSFYLQNILTQASSTDGQCYSDTSPLSIPRKHNPSVLFANIGLGCKGLPGTNT